jgi:alpha-mannosidase
LYQLSLAKLGEMISAENSYESFFVFNPLSWKRSDYSDLPYQGPYNISITDPITQKEIPFQFLEKKNEKFIRIFAQDVPPLGYKIYSIHNSRGETPKGNAAVVKKDVIENDYYKIKINAEGVILSLIDKRNTKEWIRPTNNLFANDLGSGNQTIALNDMPLKVENEGPVSTTLSSESYRPVKHISKVTLFKNSDRIELENFITQNIDEKPVTYSFSINVEDPRITMKKPVPSLMPDLFHREVIMLRRSVVLTGLLSIILWIYPGVLGE